MMPDNFRPSKMTYISEDGKEHEISNCVIGIDSSDNNDCQIDEQFLIPTNDNVTLSIDLRYCKVKKWYKKKKGNRYVHYYKHIISPLDYFEQLLKLGGMNGKF